MMRDLIMAVEGWVFEDESSIIGTAKAFLISGVALGLLAVPFYLLFGRTPANRAITLDSARWTCTRSHVTTYMTAPVMVGKVMIPGHPVSETVCDQWSAR